MGFSDRVDAAIAVLAPRLAVRRLQARAALRAYEAAKPSRLRKAKGETRSADAAIYGAGSSLRAQARYLEENHDLARGLLTTMVNNIIGPAGITVEPQPRRADGTLHEPLAADIRKIMDDAGERPEVTWEHDDARMQRMVCRTWLRDGEALAQILEGNVPRLDHGTVLPFSLELLEPDFLPLDLEDAGRGIVQGVQKNAWGRPTGYWVYKRHPGRLFMPFQIETKLIPAERMLHVKMTDRLHQTRGVSVFASVLTRVEDIKDYEESERIAARVAAAMTAYIKKGTPDLYGSADYSSEKAGTRNFKMSPGLVFDDLQPGEEVGTIDSSRPSALLTDFRGAMVRMVAAGAGATYSSIARDYNGTYSAQRQELVEGYVGYRVLGADFATQFVRPIYRRRLQLALALGIVRLPGDVDRDTLLDASYHSHAMPWIDPKKEADGLETLARAGFESEEAIMRSRGRRPGDIKAEIQRFRQWSSVANLVFSSNAANDRSAAQTKNIGDGDDDT